MRVLVFGDSITYGAWDTHGGWVERLKRDAHSTTIASEGTNKVQVINLGVGGDTSSKILARMESEIKARYSASWPFVFVFSYGANDERLVDGKVETPLELFKSNTAKIISIAKQHSSKILFVGVPPIGQQSVDFKGQEYSDDRLKDYEMILKDIVEKAELPFQEIRSVFKIVNDENLFSYDYIHPNDKGHELIYQTVKPKLEELIK